MRQVAGLGYRCGLARWAVLGAWCIMVAGCAGGAWLESPSEAELPLDRPAHGYPTAVHASLGDDAEPAAAPGKPAANPANAAEPAHASSTVQPSTAPAQTSAPPAQQRINRQPPLTPLAVIPPQYVHSQASQTQAAAPLTAPVTVPAQPPATEPAPSPTAAIASQWQPSAFLPGFESTFAAPSLSWQPPQAAPAPLPITTAATSIVSAAPNSEVNASPKKPNSPAELRARLDHAQAELMETLEAEVRRRRAENPSDEELPRLEQQLRLIYLAAGRMDDAVAEVASLDPQQREAYKHLMFGLGIWMSPDEARRPPLRSAKVLHSLRDATGELATASKLELKNLVFCERVDHFGWYGEFPRKEFQPKQQVILYAEVENFAAEHKGPAGYETELQGSYEILDSSGQIIASRQLQLDKEVCRNYRRDYFLAYRIYMPDNIVPGRYRLELTVEDLKARGKYQGRKLGEGMIEFTIR